VSFVTVVHVTVIANVTSCGVTEVSRVDTKTRRLTKTPNVRGVNLRYEPG
jgi:hypothetical protein